MMLPIVDSKYRIPWQDFRVKNLYYTQSTNPPYIMQASEEIIPVILNNFRYRMYKYFDEPSNQFKIGYGYGNPNDQKGMTEPEAYSLWISELRKKQVLLRNQIPFLYVTQSQFDALLSLYFQTGSWRIVQSREGTYDLLSAIKENSWQAAADMIANGSVKRDARMREARVMMLGDYSVERTRTNLRREGIEYTRTQYIQGIDDSFTRRQAQIAYFRQTNGAWLPNMSQAEKSVVVNMNNRL